MVAKAKGLGRGFESLIPTDVIAEEFDVTSEVDGKVSELKELRLEDIVRDEGQPRKHFDKVALEELAASIQEHGVLSPIVVVKAGKKYQIVAGERRYRASQIAEMETIPAIVRTLDAQNKLELSIIENVQRENLNPIELATAYAKLKEQFNLTDKQIGERVGKSSSSIQNTMRLLKLPDEAKRAMQEHHLMEGPMRPLITLEPEQIHEILPKMIEGGWSARKVEQYIAENKKKSSTRAVKVNEFLKEEAKLGRKYGVEVRIRGRSVTLSAKNDGEFQELLKVLGE